MRKFNVEIVVGLFVVAGFLCFAWLSIRLGDVGIFDPPTYTVQAEFGSISGLKPGATVEVAGVEVGRVDSITLTPGDRAKLVLRLQPGLQLNDDAIASIRTKGIIGDKFVKLSPGSSGKLIANGGKIRDTESAVEWEELISKYIHGKV